MLRLESYSVKINNKIIVNNFSYKFSSNKIYALIGRNGSGKTTFLKSLLSFPGIETKGKIFFKEIDITNTSFIERSNMGFVLIFQEYPKFDIEVNKLFKIKEEYIELLEIHNLINKKLFNEMSSGEKKRIDLAIALSLEPKVLLIDEIDSGVDEISRNLIINAIKRYTSLSKEYLIIMVSHNKDFLKNFEIESYLKIKNGEIIEQNYY